MARNRSQFQKGLSLSEFQNRYGTEEQCEAAVRRGRWPDGFACPRCGGREHTVTGKRRLHECHACRLQTSLKAGTIFAKSLLPLVKWFQAMFLVTQSKNSISSLEPVSYTHLRAHETDSYLVCRLLLEKKKKK